MTGMCVFFVVSAFVLGALFGGLVMASVAHDVIREREREIED